jgi:glycerophosphoryl diester phosphodiesterase
MKPQRPRLKWHQLKRRRSDPPFMRANLEAGLAAGAALEVDLVATAEGELLCLHDLTLDAETTGTGPADARTRGEIMRLRQRAPDGRAIDDPPLFLDEVAAAAGRLWRPGCGLVQLDLKEPASRFDDSLMSRLRETLGDPTPYIAGSTDWRLIDRLRAGVRGLALGFDPLDLYDQRIPRHAGEFEALGEKTLRLAPGVRIYYLQADLVLAGLDRGVNLVERVGRNGAGVDAWTIDGNRPNLGADLCRLIDAGVEQITTNDPLLLDSMFREAT